MQRQPATADYSDEVMHAALDTNMPNLDIGICGAEQEAPEKARAQRTARAKLPLPPLLLHHAAVLLLLVASEHRTFVAAH